MQGAWHLRAGVLAGLIVLTALNLRTAVAGVPPVLDEITRDVKLSAAGAGLLTMLPPLCMAAGAPLAPLVARRIGHEAGLLIVALSIAAGFLVRVPGSQATLFAGTVLAGFGVAIGNVLVPAMIKRDFAGRIGLMTGIYTMAVGASAAIAAGLVVPLERALGTDWRIALGVWGAPALLVAIAWTPLAIGGARTARRATPPPRPTLALLRDPVAIQVTLFMGFQALLFYGLLSWLPELLRDAGASRATAGNLLSTMLLAGIPTSLVVPLLAARRADQRGAVVATVAAFSVGLLGLLLSPNTGTVVWATAAGAAEGSLLGLTFLFFVNRARDALEAGRLAAMAQSFGFFIGALGPLTVGALHEITDGWSVPLMFLSAALLATLASGLGAGRNRLIST